MYRYLNDIFNFKYKLLVNNKKSTNSDSKMSLFNVQKSKKNLFQHVD